MAAVQRAIDTSSLAEVVNIILDKGLVIDAWVSVSLLGIQLLTVEARVVIASVDTYLRYATAIGQIDGSTSAALKNAAQQPPGLPTPAMTGMAVPAQAATVGV